MPPDKKSSLNLHLKTKQDKNPKRRNIKQEKKKKNPVPKLFNNDGRLTRPRENGTSFNS